jgi:hypothetical protein
MGTPTIFCTCTKAAHTQGVEGEGLLNTDRHGTSTHPPTHPKAQQARCAHYPPRETKEHEQYCTSKTTGAGSWPVPMNDGRTGKSTNKQADVAWATPQHGSSPLLSSPPYLGPYPPKRIALFCDNENGLILPQDADMHEGSSHALPAPCTKVLRKRSVEGYACGRLLPLRPRSR